MSDRFEITPTPLQGVMSLARKPLGDARGWLERMFCETDLAPVMGARRIVQMNRTLTAETGTVRGLHFQRAPGAETKIVSCLKGAIFDVALDLRAGSPSFLQWHGEVLTAENRRSLVIPEGFAHGFQTLCDDVELLYLHTAPHAPELEGGVNATDPRIGIAWPEPVTRRSPRDEGLPFLGDAFKGLAP